MSPDFTSIMTRDLQVVVGKVTLDYAWEHGHAWWASPDMVVKVFAEDKRKTKHTNAESMYIMELFLRWTGYVPRMLSEF